MKTSDTKPILTSYTKTNYIPPTQIVTKGSGYTEEYFISDHLPDRKVL
jgi:hypothetical protein